jgi:hypothetical protein
VKRFGSWVLGIAVAVLSPVLGCGRRNAPANPPPAEIHWLGIETRCHATTAADGDGKNKQPVQR